MGDHDVVTNELSQVVKVFGKCGRAGHLVGGDAVDGHVARVEPIKSGGRLQQTVMGGHQLAVADFGRADGARRSPKSVGGFEIYGGEVHALSSTPARVEASARKALPRCESSILVFGSSSAAVFPRCGISRIGSYPNPCSPRGSNVRSPARRPISTRRVDPSGVASAAAHTNDAPRCVASISASWASSNSRLAWSSPCLPAQRAEKMPGAPFITSTASPESSATAIRPVEREVSVAYLRA